MVFNFAPWFFSIYLDNFLSLNAFLNIFMNSEGYFCLFSLTFDVFDGD